MNLFKNFLREEEGLGTVEIVLILVVLVSIALMFRNTITDFVKTTLGNISGDLTEGGKKAE
jgi:Flp pilus assembly pilin Flp